MRRLAKLKRKNRISRKLAALILSVCMSGSIAGCGSMEGTKVVLTTGFSENELFRIEDLSCTQSEFMVYLVNYENAYENGFGKEIIDAGVGDYTMSDYVKQRCLNTIAQVKAMNLLAKENEIALTEAEETMCKSAGEEYYDSLSPEEKQAMCNVSAETITGLYREYAVADKLYDYIIRDINPEISDDEARTITVEQIVLNTWKLDSGGNKVAYDDAEKRTVYNTASGIIRQINEGTDFDLLIEQYNEAEEGTVSFGKGEMDKSIESVAFNLNSGEVSGIIETADAYVILKCVSTFNREETEANKVRIVEEKKREVFGQQYDAFAANLSRVINEALWKKISTNDIPETVSTDSFFDIYSKYFDK